MNLIGNDKSNNQNDFNYNVSHKDSPIDDFRILILTLELIQISVLTLMLILIPRMAVALIPIFPVSISSFFLLHLMLLNRLKQILTIGSEMKQGRMR